ncbi:hypothetical protein E2C01_086900 [Portunus trituberculatus]|uniref:Uncharacterized protein n=1 Tax=Portunus trituberculatus TaxID=210409 RepID=A0A5B7J531_PORTR|nr:hypothetical protein [Portunus trituberculatus]
MLLTTFQSFHICFIYPVFFPSLLKAKGDINNASSSTSTSGNHRVLYSFAEEGTVKSASPSARNVSPSIAHGVNIPIVTKVSPTHVRRESRLRCESSFSLAPHTRAVTCQPSTQGSQSTQVRMRYWNYVLKELPVRRLIMLCVHLASQPV